MAPATPRRAASLILMRAGAKHGEDGVQVLLVQRSPESSFMPGVWVFPGGVVEPEEPLAAAIQERNLDPEELAHRACAIRELHEEAGIELAAAAELRPWSRWITPDLVPVRFDTRFYVAVAPAHSPPRPDGVETTDAGWFSPHEALERHRAGDLSLVFPTIKHLEQLLPHASASDVLAAADERPIEPITPRVIGQGDDRRVVLPGDAGY
jgi:8-oxo-dGTP pyrophosphatase MutT (NUDIX family)